MDEFWKVIAGSVLTGLGLFWLVVFLMANNPNALAKWAAIGYGLLHRLFGFAHRRYLQFDLQSKINDFTLRLAAEVPSVADTQCSVELVSANLTRKAFLEEGKVIVRLRKDDRRDENFIHGSYLYVSTGLLHTVKRYLSPTQREAIDLFVTLKLLEVEKMHLRGIFLDEYVHTRVGKSEKLGPLLQASDAIDRAGLYFPVLIQELDFLGHKVFGRPQSAIVISEVTALLEFLERIATRRTGDEGELNFCRDYCKAAVVIIGKAHNITEGAGPWTRYIHNQIVPNGIETIYLVGADYNIITIRAVATSLTSSYESYREHRYDAVLRNSDGEEFTAGQHLMVLRKLGARTIQSPPRGTPAASSHS